MVEAAAQPTAVGQTIAYGPFTIETVALDRVDLIEKNARFMRAEVFQQLVRNVAQDGALSQIPFCVRSGDRFVTLSGNHRVKAARADGHTAIAVIYYTDRELSREEQVAIQLSHNAVVGEDDATILLELFSELGDIARKEYTGLDDKLLEQLGKVDLTQIAEVRLDFKSLSFLFVPEEIEAVEETLETARAMVSGTAVYVVRMKAFDQLLDALAKVKASYNIGNAATGLQVVLDVFKRHQDDLADGWWDPEAEAAKVDKQWVPLASILNGDEVPAEAGAVILKAVTKMRDAGDIQAKSLWKALEYWAADYLSGGQT